jgi:hypothetical protein
MRIPQLCVVNCDKCQMKTLNEVTMCVYMS